MVSISKSRIEDALISLEEILRNTIPTFTKENYKADPIGVKSKWNEFLVDLRDLERIQTEIKESREDLIQIIKRMADGSRAAAEADIERFDQEIELKPKIRAIAAKLREMKRTEAVLSVIISEEEKREKLEEKEVAQILNENQARATAEAVAAMTRAVQSMQIPGRRRQQQNSDPDDFRTSPPRAKSVKLPDLQLPKFRGYKDNWVEFWEQFKGAIHSDNSLPEARKLIYLKNLVEGEPKELISPLSIEDTNYEIARKILEEKYGDKEAILRNLHMELAHLRPSENFADDKKFSIDMERLCLQLESMKQDINNPQVLIALQNKLSRFTLRKVLDIKNTLPTSEKWDVKRFRKTLNLVIQRECEVEQIYIQSHSNIEKAKTPIRNITAKERSNRFNKDPKQTMFAAVEKDRKKIVLSGQRKEQRYVGNREIRDKVRKKFCNLCETEGHWSAECRKYPDLKSRLIRAKGLNRCLRCLGQNHSSRECVREFRECFFCKEKKHVNALCPSRFTTHEKAAAIVSIEEYESEEEEEDTAEEFEEDETVEDEQSCEEDREEEPNREVQGAAFSSGVQEGKKRLLMTTWAEIYNPKCSEKKKKCLIFFDTGGERTCIKENVAKRLNLTPIGSDSYRLQGFRGIDLGQYTAQVTQFGVRTQIGNCLVVASIADKVISPIIHIPAEDEAKIFAHEIVIPKTLTEPDIMIGIDNYHLFDIRDREELPSGFWISDSNVGPMINGWGKIQNKLPKLAKEITMASAIECSEERTDDDALDQLIQKHYSIETLGMKDADESEMEAWNREFRMTFNKEGRYEVCLPFNEKAKNLESNCGLAYGRLRSNLKKLRENPDKLQKYHETIIDQLKREMIEEVKNPKKSVGVLHYIPHQAVIKEDKATTKLRIVNDASARGSKFALSLNDCLPPGPNLLNDLSGLLIRARIDPYLLCADIEKAFLNISINPNDRDALRFLWMKDPLKEDSQMVVYRFTRLPFGLICSPAVLATVIQRHLDNQKSPLAMKVKQQLYVDNLLIGIKDASEILELYKQLKEIFRKAKMNLREFLVNNEEQMVLLPKEDRASEEGTKILGIPWNVKRDELTIKFPKIPEDEKITKRTILSRIAQVFDPLGWVSPCLLQAKLFLQNLWSMELGWDETIPEEFIRDWKSITDEWTDTSIHLERKYFATNLSDSAKYSIHAFADASGQAFGIAIFLIAREDEDQQISLVQGKSLIKPTRISEKQDTIPRMELQALKIAVTLAVKVRKELEYAIPIQHMQFWTDSKDVIDWLNSHKRYERFIENRLHKIRPYKVTHVKGEMNPADVGSRGCSPAELSSHPLWPRGPKWLLETIKEGQENSEFDPDRWKQEENEKEKFEIGMPLTTDPPESTLVDLDRFSGWHKLVRVVAFSSRWFKKKRNKSLDASREADLKKRIQKLTEKIRPVEAEEMQKAEVCLIKEAQLRFPPTEEFVKQQNVTKNDKGLLICQGRLSNADLAIETINPIFLSGRSSVAQLIIRSTHWDMHHANVSSVLSRLRLTYFIPQVRQTIFNVLRKNPRTLCRVCLRYKSKGFSLPKEPALPEFRVKAVRPFQSVGLDYFGPLWVGKKGSKKVWGCIFVCATTRAIHLEIVENCTASEFLLAFRRFCARRLEPERIVSDNALQFKLASRAIKQLWTAEQCSWSKVFQDSEVQRHMAKHGIEWMFITERAPWRGFYEKQIHLLKQPLHKVLGRRAVKQKELETLLTEIERIVNERPLTYISETEPLRVLRPIDFLIPFAKEASYREIEAKEIEKSLNPTEKELLIQNEKIRGIANQFWKLWQKGYLLALRDLQKYRGKNGQKFPEVGEVVLLQDDNHPRSQWRLAKVETLLKSGDGAIRSARVTSYDGKRSQKITRPINLIFPLELADNQSRRIQDKNESSNLEVELNNGRRRTLTSQ